MVIGLWILAQPLVGDVAAAHPTAALPGPGTGPQESRHHVTDTGATTDAFAATTTDNKAVPYTLTQAQVHRLLLSVEALAMEAHNTDISVQSSVLCFCLTKAPHTVQELRRAAAERFREGLVHVQAQRYDQAVAAFTQAAQLHPRAARTYLNRGVVYGKMGHYQQALQDLTTAITLAPQQAEAYYARSLTAMLAGDQHQATQDAHRAAHLGYPPALRLYQATHRLPVTGVLDDVTRSSLDGR
jgi:tetratricopeptide (TPR) repeat protein